MKEFKELKSELFKINKTLKEIKGINHSSLMTNIINIADIKKEDKELLALLMQNKYDNIVINNNEECFNNIKTYLNLIKPINLDVTKLIRIGGKKRWWLCNACPPPL